MAWLKIDDRVRTHPKIVQAGPAAAWLWFCSVCYAREHLTDGFIPTAAVATLTSLPSAAKHAAKLVAVRLWEEADGGFHIHDFLDWNPSRAEVLSLRDKERDKKRTYRGTDEGHARDTSRVYAGARGSGSVGALVVSGSGEESARETTPLIDGPGMRRHGLHAWCDFQRQVCVPMGLHSEFKARLGTDDADARLRAWYPTVIATYEGQAIGTDVFPFWRAAFAAWQPTPTPRPVNAGGAGDGLRYHWRDECAVEHGGRCESATFHAAKMAEREVSA